MRILLALLFGVLAPPFAPGAVDPGERAAEFGPKGSDQPRIDMERAHAGGSHSVRDGEVQFVTVPAAEALSSKAIVVEKQRAPVSTAAQRIVTRKPEAAAISTATRSPAKFERKYEAVAAAQFQEGMGEATRIKATKTKAAAKPSVIERINRFVFRKNEPPPAATQAGGGNPAVDDPPAESPSGGS